jgi:hypothetical protein
MANIKKNTGRAFLVFLILIPVSAFAHFIFFPQQTRSILIDYSSFKKNGRLYFNAGTPQRKIDSVQYLIQLASARVASFWGQKNSIPQYIYCDSDADFKKFGSPFPVPALTHLKLGAAIVISSEGADLDILAHEICHAELYERIGFYNRTFKIPIWFDEGLAMQNDYRNYYSEDSLKLKSDNYKNLPNVKKLKTGKQFSEESSNEKIMLNYIAAKHEIKNWYTKEKLDKFIEAINTGKTFEEAFNQ